MMQYTMIYYKTIKSVKPSLYATAQELPTRLNKKKGDAIEYMLGFHLEKVQTKLELN